MPVKRSAACTPLSSPQADDDAFTPPIRDPRIRTALIYLRENKTAKLSEVAARLNLSISRFRHLFNKEVGVSPKHYVMSLRLRWAKKLLENSLLEVKEITAVIGVNDVSHFVRNYKAAYRQTPSQTRALGPNGNGIQSLVAISAKK